MPVKVMQKAEQTMMQITLNSGCPRIGQFDLLDGIALGIAAASSVPGMGGSGEAGRTVGSQGGGCEAGAAGDGGCSGSVGLTGPSDAEVSACAADDFVAFPRFRFFELLCGDGGDVCVSEGGLVVGSNIQKLSRLR